MSDLEIAWAMSERWRVRRFDSSAWIQARMVSSVMKMSQPLANKIGASAEIILTSSSDFITFYKVSPTTSPKTDCEIGTGYLDSCERELVDFKVVFSILDFVDDMLPIRRQHIPVRPLQSLCDILKSLIELGCCRNISTLRDGACGPEMASTGCWIIRERRRLDWRDHLLLWPTLRWWWTVLVWIHYFISFRRFAGKMSLTKFESAIWAFLRSVWSVV